MIVLSIFGLLAYRSTIFALISVCLSVPQAMAELTPNNKNNEDKISQDRKKATYLYQITKFIDWSHISLNQATINLCVLDQNSLHGELQKIHLLPIKERTLHVKYVNPSIPLGRCNMLYLNGNTPKNYIRNNYTEISENHVLTIGENKSFAQDGGIIAFDLIHNKLEVEVNLQAAADAEIGISANLVEMATKVYGLEKSSL